MTNPTAIVRNKKTYRRVSEYISSDGEVGYYNHDTKTFQVRGETTKTNFETEEHEKFAENVATLQINVELQGISEAKAELKSLASLCKKVVKALEEQDNK